MNNVLLSLIVCPVCNGKLRSKSPLTLRCASCAKEYAVKHGIPVLVDLDNLPKHLVGQIRYFQANSKDYGTVKAVEPWQKKYEDRLFQSLARVRGRVLIDDACGSGYVSLEAAKRGMTVLACDLNLSGLIKLRRQAEHEGLSHLFPVCCSAENLPIRSYIGDALVANAILEHLPKEMQAIKEITRVTKRNGLAIITVPLAYHLLHPLFLPLNIWHDRQIGHLRRYTKEQLTQKFSAWKPLEVIYAGHTSKVAKTLVNMILPVFNPESIEEEDEKYSQRKLFASNISVVFKKKS